MKKGENMVNRIKVNRLLFIIPLLFFLLICFQMTNLSLSTKIDGINLKEFANNRNTRKEVLQASRGTIYTYDGAILAQNIDSYTVIAYLSEKRSEGAKTPRHVVDKEKTAATLAPILNMSVEDLLKLLNKKNLYQVELRPGGMGITEIKKEEIEKLQLPGIDFIGTYKRYYPNNDFLSYTLGYVTMNDDSKLSGEMGIEKYFNEELSGEDGYLEYQKDLNGYKIPNTPEERKDALDGMNIYLTIDDNIQMFTERVVKDATEKYGPDWMIITVADAKTGRILGTASTPSFNPNTKNIESYLNPLVSYTYEPGSTMKTFSYMAAIEKGTYDGTTTFNSGHLTIDDATISDWNNKGWGTINFDQGYALSSNVGAASMIDKFISGNDLKDYYKKLGFGKKTGFELPNEAGGLVKFKYKVEVANAAFGQGITTTPIQLLQALTSLANDGIMIKPYIVDKIVDPNTGKNVYQGKREEVAKVASTATINKMKDLMYNVINGDATNATGYSYKVEGYDIIGKTGTAQYVNPNTGKYCTGENDYIRSFAGMFPKDDPQIIIYGAVKRPNYGASAALSIAVKKLINDIGKYLNIKGEKVNNEVSDTKFIVPNLLNESIDKAKTINHTTIVIGDGNKVISQYPKASTVINDDDKMFILSNSKNITLESMNSWSSRDVITYCNLLNIKCNISGYGFVSSQNVSAGTNIANIAEVNIALDRTSDKVKVGS
jgi:penicillin-binding protein 2B